MKYFPRTVLLLLGTFVLASCGGTATTSGLPNGDGDTGDGDLGDGDQGDGDAGDGDAGDGDTATCAGYDDDSPSHLDILIRNDRSEPIYLGPRDPTCGTPPFFSVSDAQGNPLNAHSTACSFTCQQFLDSGNTVCPGICLYPELVRIDPGDGYSTAWDTRVFVSRNLSEECGGADSQITSCAQAQRIEPGTFSFGATAGTEVSCDSATDQDCFDRTVGGEVLTAETTVRLDGSYGVFEKGDGSGNDADPAPKPNPDPAPGANYGVEIVFRE